MATEGIEGLYVETRDYAATAAFWAALGYTAVFESDHGSGQWVHPAGGPYVFVSERSDGDLETQPILRVTDASTFDRGDLDVVQDFIPQHWNVLEALVRDPDGRIFGLHAPLPEA